MSEKIHFVLNRKNCFVECGKNWTGRHKLGIKNWETYKLRISDKISEVTCKACLYKHANPKHTDFIRTRESQEYGTTFLDR